MGKKRLTIYKLSAFRTFILLSAILPIVPVCSAQFSSTPPPAEKQVPEKVIIDTDIGDRAVFSGVIKLEPLTATIDSMLDDAAVYAAHKAHFGDPPAK